MGEAVLLYDSQEPRGEYVLVIEGADPEKRMQAEREDWEKLSVQEHVAMYEAQGLARKDAMKKAAEDRGVSKREIYQALISVEE